MKKYIEENPIFLHELYEVLGVNCPYEDKLITGIACEKRFFTPGCVFFAIRTWRLDSYADIELAMQINAAVIVSEKEVEGYPCIVVSNSYEAYIKFVEWYRNRIELNVVAITGSVGKTSTTDMMVSMLKESFRVSYTCENENVSDQAASAILNLPKNIDVYVQEAAIQQIHDTSIVVQPRYAVITNIGCSHFSTYMSRDNIAIEKMKILDGLCDNGLVFLNIDDEILVKYTKKLTYKIKTYSMINPSADYYAEDIQLVNGGYNFNIHYKNKTISVRLNSLGKHNVSNALAVFAVGIEMGVSVDSIVCGIAKWTPSGYRQNIINLNSVTVIADCYNAAPKSIKAALDMLTTVETSGKRIAVLADILEMGDESIPAHIEIGEYINSKDIDLIVLYGTDIMAAYDKIDLKEHVYATSSWDDLLNFLKSSIKLGDTVLFKGSHGMGLVAAIDILFNTSLAREFTLQAHQLVMIRKTKNIIKCFSDLNIKKVAIYGFTGLGKSLLDFFDEIGQKVEYIIDDRYRFSPNNIYSAEFKCLNDDLPQVDLVIMTRINNIDDAKRIMQEKINGDVLEYAEFINLINKKIQ